MAKLVTVSDSMIRLLFETLLVSRKVDVRLPGKGNSNSQGARPVYLIITMIKWIRTSRLSIKNYLSFWYRMQGSTHARGVGSIQSSSAHSVLHTPASQLLCSSVYLAGGGMPCPSLAVGHESSSHKTGAHDAHDVQGYLAHKKQHSPLGPP